jgi:hypothetical protein
MGEVELAQDHRILTIHSKVIVYGNAASEDLAQLMRDEIESMWNAPRGIVYLNNQQFLVRFSITAQSVPAIDMDEVYMNTDPRNNYFRIEEYASSNISFVDGLGCNTGYFLLENLYSGSTTAAHEYGHTLGLDHPRDIDYRGKGAPGIMYPRGTLVDAVYQYDPSVPAGVKGGTLYPIHRRVLQADIDDLRLQRLRFRNGTAVLGDFTNIFHFDHREQ